MSLLIERMSDIALVSFEDFDSIPILHAAYIWPRLLVDVKPVKEILRDPYLRADKDILMPHCTEILLLARTVRLSIIKQHNPSETGLNAFPFELCDVHIGELCTPPQLAP